MVRVEGGSDKPERRRAVEMTELRIGWKTKGRFPARSSVPWKSRKGGEIPPFPQLRRILIHRTKTGEPENESYGKVEIQNPDSHFPTAPKSLRRKEGASLIHSFSPQATHAKQRGR